MELKLNAVIEFINELYRLAKLDNCYLDVSADDKSRILKIRVISLVDRAHRFIYLSYEELYDCCLSPKWIANVHWKSIRSNV